jgi:hypothetical protein
MNALFSSVAWCAAKPNRWSILAVLTFALLWPFVNGPLEGNILVVLDSTNGITVSDLFSVLAVMIALIQAIRLRRTVRSGARLAAGDTDDGANSLLRRGRTESHGEVDPKTLSL